MRGVADAVLGCVALHDLRDLWVVGVRDPREEVVLDVVRRRLMPTLDKFVKPTRDKVLQLFEKKKRGLPP